MRFPSTPLLTLSLLSTSLIACGGDEPPAPSEVRAALRDDLARILRESQAASEVNLPTGAAFGFATFALGGTDSAAFRTLAPLRSLIDRPSEKSDVAFLDEEEETGLDTDAIVEQLEQEVFTDANYLGNGIYRVPASLVCEQTTYDETTGESTTGIDPECAQRLDQAQLRIRVESENDGIRFFVQVDANHDEPLSMLLTDDEVALTVNLDDAGDAMVALAQVFGEEAPNAELAGSITGSLKVLGTAHARAALTFDRAISIEFADQGVALDSDGAFRFSSAAGTIVSVEANANTPSATLALGIGETRAHVPGDELDPAATDVFLAGSTMSAQLQGSTVTVSNISLGGAPLTVHIGGQLANSIDLNPNDGGSLDATVTVDAAAGTETIEVSPRLDLHTQTDHAVLGDEAPVYDTTRVQIEGTLRGHADGIVEVVSGSASITTNPAQYGFSATAGQCITATEVYDDVTFTSYTTYAVGACQ